MALYSKSKHYCFIICLVFCISGLHSLNAESKLISGKKIEFVELIDTLDDYNQTQSFWEKIKNILTNTPNPALVSPMGIDISTNLLAIADPGAGGVHLLDRKNKVYHLLKYSTDNNYFHSPIDVTIYDKYLYITYSDFPGISKFNKNGKFIALLQPENNTTRYTGITTQGHNLYLVDTGNHRIIKTDLQGKLLSRFGLRGSKIDELNFPTFICSSINGKLYITDSMNFRILSYDSENKCEKSIGKRGIMSGQFNRPKGLCTVDDILFVVDGSFNNIQLYSTEGKYLWQFGGFGSEAGKFSMPVDIASDNQLIYISDNHNRRIQIFRIIDNEK